MRLGVKEHSRPYDAKTLKAMRARAEEAEAIVRAIQFGHVDAIVRYGPQGPHVFSLEGAAHLYRAVSYHHRPPPPTAPVSVPLV